MQKKYNETLEDAHRKEKARFIKMISCIGLISTICYTNQKLKMPQKAYTFIKEACTFD